MQIHCTALFQTLVPLSISDSTFVKFTSISMFRDKQYLQGNESDKKEKKGQGQQGEKTNEDFILLFSLSGTAQQIAISIKLSL